MDKTVDANPLMIQVLTERGPEMRAVDHTDIADSWVGKRNHRGVVALHPVLLDGEVAFHCIDCTVYVVRDGS